MIYMVSTTLFLTSKELLNEEIRDESLYHIAYYPYVGFMAVFIVN